MVCSLFVFVLLSFSAFSIPIVANKYQNTVKQSNPYSTMIKYNDVVFNSPLSVYRVYDPKLEHKFLLNNYIQPKGQKVNLKIPIPPAH
jgi:hypothetical protein